MNEKGDPFHGKLGVLDVNEQGTLCHVCGTRTLHIVHHIINQRIGINDYCLVFMVSKDELTRHD